MGCGSSQVHAVVIPGEGPIVDASSVDPQKDLKPEQQNSKVCLLPSSQQQQPTKQPVHSSSSAPNNNNNASSTPQHPPATTTVLPPVIVRRPPPKPKAERKQFCFLFGETSTERKIVCFNSLQPGFSTISSRTKIPSPPLKYQPVEVIYEESQELFSSNLFTNNSHPPYNFMLALWVDPQKIFLCGGVNFDFDYVSSESFYFDTAADSSGTNQTSKWKLGHNLMGTRFDKLPFMHTRRYSHMGVVMSVGSVKYVYVFGGRSENEQILKECERYSIPERKWKKIAPMNIGRSTGFSLIFNDKVYVFGGYSGNSKRPKKIEVYDPDKDYWEIINVRLHRGIEAGLVYSTKPNEVLIVGGNLECGSVKSCIKINIEEQTYICQAQMKRQRLLQKGIQGDSELFVFGGDFMDGMEIYSVKEKRWRESTVSYSSHVSTEDINSFSFSVETVVVEREELPPVKNDPFSDDKYYLFGNDQAPCITQINLSKFVSKKKAVPMSLRLRSHMGSLLIKQGKYFVCGGVSQFYQKATGSTYMYYSQTNKAIEHAKMNQARYSFSMYKLGDYVYVFGGKKNEDTVLKSCQRFNIQSSEAKWESVGDLNFQRHSCSVIEYDGKLIILGGRNEVAKVEAVQIFDPATKQFTVIPGCSVVLEGAIAIKKGDGYYAFGGTDQLGDNYNILRIEIHDPTKSPKTTAQVQPVQKHEETETAKQEGTKKLEANNKQPQIIQQEPTKEGQIAQPHPKEEKEVAEDKTLKIKLTRLEEVQKVYKAISCEAGIFLIKKNKALLFKAEEKVLEDKILINQIQMSNLELDKLCVA